MAEPNAAVVGEGPPAPPANEPQGAPPAPAESVSPPASTRPPSIPERFWDAEKGEARSEEMGTSYTELQKKLSSSRPAKPGDLAVTAPKPGDLNENATVADVIQAAGLQPEEMAAHFAEHGNLTDEHYASLQKVGFGKGVVNEFLASQQTLAQQHAAVAHDYAVQAAGGDAQVDLVLQWAKGNLSPEDMQWYNSQVSGPGATTISSNKGVDWLMAKYNEAVGSGRAAPLVDGKPAAVAAQGAFSNQDEMLAAMSNPKYAPTLPGNVPDPDYDPVFEQRVNARLMQTDMGGPR